MTRAPFECLILAIQRWQTNICDTATRKLLRALTCDGEAITRIDGFNFFFFGGGGAQGFQSLAGTRVTGAHLR